MGDIRREIAKEFNDYLQNQHRDPVDAGEAQKLAESFIDFLDVTYGNKSSDYLYDPTTIEQTINNFFQTTYPSLHGKAKNDKKQILLTFQTYARTENGLFRRLQRRSQDITKHPAWLIISGMGAVLGLIVLISSVGAACGLPLTWWMPAPIATPIARLFATTTPTPSSTPTSTNTPSVTPTSTSTATPTLTPTPVSIPMTLDALKIIDTGAKGGICGYSKEHAIVRDRNEHLHIFFVTGADPTAVYEIISTDNGETWSAPAFVGGFDVQGKIIGFSCSAAVDPQGNIHVLFDLNGSDIGYTILPSGGRWQEAKIRGQGLPDVGTFAATLATGPGNQIHAIFSSKKIWYTFFDGSGWSRETEVVPGGWHPDIFVDGNNGRHVVYNGANFIPDKSGDGSSPVTVYYTYSADGTHWTDEQAVPPDDGIWKGDATIKVDSRGRRHITYIEWAPLEGNLFYTYSDDGQAWSLPRQLNIEPGVTTGNDGNESAAMELDPNDNLYVVWLGLHGSGPKKDNWLTMRWLNKSTQEWSDPLYITKVAGGVGDEASLPYEVFDWTNKNNFTVDMAWNSAGEVYYGRAEFKK